MSDIFRLEVKHKPSGDNGRAAPRERAVSTGSTVPAFMILLFFLIKSCNKLILMGLITFFHPLESRHIYTMPSASVLRDGVVEWKLTIGMLDINSLRIFTSVTLQNGTVAELVC